MMPMGKGVVEEVKSAAPLKQAFDEDILTLLVYKRHLPEHLPEHLPRDV